MNTIIRTLQQVQQAQADAWVQGAIVTGIALALAVTIAFIIKYRNDRRDYLYRRIWFIVTGLALPLANWVYNKLVILPKIQSAAHQNMFESTNLKVLLVSIAAYAVVGIVLMFCFRTSKLGTILGKMKK